MYGIDPESAGDAIDVLITQLTASANQRLRDAVAADSDLVAIASSALDVGSVMSLLGDSVPLFEVAMRRLRLAYERTADGCIAQLALQITLQAAAQATEISGDKVRHIRYCVHPSLLLHSASVCGCVNLTVSPAMLPVCLGCSTYPVGRLVRLVG